MFTIWPSHSTFARRHWLATKGNGRTLCWLARRPFTFFSVIFFGSVSLSPLFFYFYASTRHWQYRTIDQNAENQPTILLMFYTPLHYDNTPKERHGKKPDFEPIETITFFLFRIRFFGLKYVKLTGRRYKLPR